MKKKIQFILIISILFLSSTPVFAKESIPTATNDTPTASASTPSLLSNDNVLRAVGYHRTEKVISSRNLKHKFIGYASTYWSKASSYSPGKSYSISGSITYAGISIAVSFTASLQVTIPANPSRYSKLAGFQDLYIQKVRVDYYLTGAKYKTEYIIKTKVKDKYLDVVYK